MSQPILQTGLLSQIAAALCEEIRSRLSPKIVVVVRGSQVIFKSGETVIVTILCGIDYLEIVGAADDFSQRSLHFYEDPKSLDTLFEKLAKVVQDSYSLYHQSLSDPLSPIDAKL